MSFRDGEPTIQIFEHQADATLSQNNPVSGTKYTVLDTTKNVRIISIAVVCTWTVQPSPLKIHVTINGQQITHLHPQPISTTNYQTILDFAKAPSQQSLTTIEYAANRSFQYEGRSVKVEAEITGGTVSNLSARVKYARIP